MPAAYELIISGHQQRWPGPFQGPSSYPQLCFAAGRWFPRQNGIYASLQPALPGLGNEGLIEGKQKNSILKMFYNKTFYI